MPILGELLAAILKKTGESQMTLSRQAMKIVARFGPMSGDEARWIIAHEAGIDLRKFGLSAEELVRVQTLRASMHPAQPQPATPKPDTSGSAKAPSDPAPAGPPTSAAIIKGRGFHSAVWRSSRKLFVDGHRTECVRRAFQAVNNRVKKLAGSTKDGQGLMGEVFGVPDPDLQFTTLASTSEKDEQDGLKFLMMGSIAGLRNPTTHDEEWTFEGDRDAVLEALAFASLLHRYLDRCEAFQS